MSESNKSRETWKSKYMNKGRHISLYPEQYDYLFKILVVGDSGVGKTSLLLRYVDDKYTESYDFTIGVDFKTKIILVNGKRVKLYIWDTSGQERFRAITASYYRDAHGVLLVYDVTNPASFDHINLWLQESITHGNDSMTYALIGNKTDLSKDREVGNETGKTKSAELKIPFFETSTKESLNVEQAFLSLVQEMFKTIDITEIETKADDKGNAYLKSTTSIYNKENCYC